MNVMSPVQPAASDGNPADPNPPAAAVWASSPGTTPCCWMTS